MGGSGDRRQENMPDRCFIPSISFRHSAHCCKCASILTRLSESEAPARKSSSPSSTTWCILISSLKYLYHQCTDNLPAVLLRLTAYRRQSFPKSLQHTTRQRRLNRWSIRERAQNAERLSLIFAGRGTASL